MNKKMFFRCLCAVLCILLLPVGLLIAGASMPRLYGESYYAELPAMVSRLRNAQGKKLVLIGGSSVAFGIDVEQLESEFPGYTVCPMGLYAAVGTDAMLSLSEPYLGEGDIVVLAIEPSSETFSTYFGAQAFWKCAESDPWLLTLLSSDQKSALAGSYIPYLQERAEIVRSGNYPKAEGVYARSSFDENCSLTYDRAGNTMALGFDTSKMVDFSSVAIEEEFAERVNRFISIAERRGAAVYLSFSPVNRLALEENWEEGLEAFYTVCTETFSCRIISDPEKLIMDSGWFYDSNFHLNTPGSRLRTHMLACDLLAEQGIYQEPDFETPQMPESIYQTAEESSDTSDFLLEEYHGGWIVAGLTEVGMEKESLTVPENVDGKPVVAFASDAFSGAEKLEELTLPETIEAIPDGAFENCPSLNRLVLTHNEKVCSLGEEPFRGADSLKIYVPRDSYSLYRDGAGCEENPWQPYLNRIETY